LLSIALLSAACGSDSGGKKAGTGTTAPGAAAGSSTAIPEAKDIVAAALKRPTTIPVTKELGAAVAARKRVYWIQCSIPACTQLGHALEDAAKRLNWNLRIVDGGITPESIKAAWEIAARDRPDAVIASGFPRTIFEQELQTLAAAKIPVVNVDVTDKAGNGLTYVVQGEAEFVANGALKAAWVLSEGGTKSNALLVTTSAFPVVAARGEGFKQEFKRLCPNCGLRVMQASPTDIGTTLPTKIVAELQANPDINFVELGVGDFATGLPSALAAAGLSGKVKIILSDINPALEQEIRSGGPIKATLMMEAVDMMWVATDVLLRSFAGQPIDASDGKPSMWVVTKDNIGSFAEPYPIVADYQKQFATLWGLR
jgi:ribose transport system substrate-binding protein